MIYKFLNFIENNKIIKLLFIDITSLLMFLLLYLKWDNGIFFVSTFLIIIFLINIIYLSKRRDKILDIIVKYRYLIALITFIICLLFKINNSSLCVYDLLFEKKNPDINSMLVGKIRDIRSDEYAVQTSYYFSQYYNNFKKINNYISLSGQDMILGYNAPVLDISIISKPLHWGYILLGNEYGLSWYTSLKLILLITVSFEFIMIITKKNIKISVLGIFMIAFSPVMQWWFSPHFPDVFLWGMILLVLGYYFFTSNSKTKLVLSIFLSLSIIAFALALYPSLQVPFVYFLVALLICLLIRDKEKFSFNKKDIKFLILISIIAGGVIIYEIVDSKEAIELLMNTIYPGRRIEVGGTNRFSDLFTNLTVIFLPFKDINELNNCEVSNFIHFAPLLFMFYPVIYKKLKKDNNREYLIGNCLIFAMIIEILYMLVGLPLFLSKLTLFNYINRMYLVYGFTAVLFTLWCIYIISSYKIKFDFKYCLFCLSLFTILYYFTITPNNLLYLPKIIYIGEIFLLVFIGYLILKGYKDIVVTLLILISIMSGFTVNPINKGISSITNHAIYDKVQELKDNDKYFIATDNFVYADYILASGGKVINASNYYTDIKKNNLLDSDNKYKDIYNRYSNIIVNLVTDETNYELLNQDAIIINLNYHDLKRLNVGYILTTKNQDEYFDLYNINYEIVYKDQKYIIYDISYS